MTLRHVNRTRLASKARWILFVTMATTFFGFRTRGMFEVLDAEGKPTSSNSFPIRLKGDPYPTDWDEIYPDRDQSPCSKPLFYGIGREYSIFETSHPRGGARNNLNGKEEETDEGIEGSINIDVRDDDDDDDDDDDIMMRMQRYRERQREGTSSSPYFSGRGKTSSSYRQRWRQKREQSQNPMPRYIQTIQNWWITSVSPNVQSLPKIVCRVEPTTTLKLRKTFRPLKTIIRFGADYNTQLGVWQFKSSWEDAIIGGKLTLAGRELQLTKSWQLSVGAVEDLVTRLRFRAAINLQTFQAYARVGFRTERLTPIDVVEGFTILKRVPLDGRRGNVKLEVKANIALPEPEIEYSTETQRSLIGMGDIEVNIDELNLLLDY